MVVEVGTILGRTANTQWRGADLDCRTEARGNFSAACSCASFPASLLG
jgi:hypothetical protein